MLRKRCAVSSDLAINQLERDNGTLEILATGDPGKEVPVVVDDDGAVVSIDPPPNERSTT